MSSDEQWDLGGDSERVCLNTEEALPMIPDKGSNCGIHTPRGSAGGYIIRCHREMNLKYQSGPTRQEGDCHLLNSYCLPFDNSSTPHKNPTR